MATDSVLLDTHAVLWAVGGPTRLGAHTRHRMRDAPTVYFSAVSVWEIRIKEATGKLQAVPHLLAELAKAGCVELAVTARHVDTISTVDLPHDDPFDRLLAQARAEGLAFVTADRVILASGQADLVDART